MSYQTMPFGKFKGELIQDLPANYLTYALIEFDLPYDIKKVMFDSLMAHINGDLFISENEIGSDKINKVYKQLSFKYHPDKGGSTEAMQAINDFRRMINE